MEKIRKKAQKIRHMTNFDDPVNIGLMTETLNMEYRRKVMHISNILRMLFAVICIIFAPFLLDFSTNHQILIWTHSFSQRTDILIFGSIYILLLAMSSLFNMREYDSENVFLFNALINAIFIALFFISLDLFTNWYFLLPICFFTILSSLLSLNLFQNFIYSTFLYLEMVLIYILWEINLLKLPLIKNHSLEYIKLKGLVHSHSGTIWNAALLFAGLALLIFLVGFLANNARENSILAKVNHFFYEQGRKLNESIIAEMQIGLIVVNGRNDIIIMNPLARKYFNIQSDEQIPSALKNLSPLLAKQFARWQDLRLNEQRPLNLFNQTYTATFTPLSIQGYASLTMIELENIEISYQRVRETRLASLGKLTAGIAHEIRNPLGTVQSSGELIAEFSDDEKIKKLCDKIKANSKRINAIISDILDMFNNKPNDPKLLKLNEYIRYCVETSRADDDLEYVPIRLVLEATAGVSINFDPSHLNQILHNLMLNCVKHGRRFDGIRIMIRTHIDDSGRMVYLDVIDNGQGVEKEKIECIFEPFFSTSQGTGLGLYLVREMCLANQSSIVYVPQKMGACFRIKTERFFA